MELLDYARVIRAHWAGVALIVLLALGGAGAYTLTQPQIYAANANGFVSAGGASDAAMQSVLALAPMRSVALRRMNLDELFVELVGGEDAGVGTMTGTMTGTMKGATIDA